ncbi:F0F1 ATP synthase assembly protein I [Alteromonadaceae bacterium M269]|nr:F0F1 ATP synthase assembly protein I [Alteromonadaceae bacterium M269]
MIISLIQEGKLLARKVLVSQSIVAVFISIFYTFFVGKTEGISAFYGGFICVFPNFIFAHLAFKYAGASQNKLVVRSFNKGSKLKFFFTIILFSIVFQWNELVIEPLMISYVVTMLAQWLTIIFFNRVKEKRD